MTSRKRGLAAENCSKLRQQCRILIWATLETNLIRKACPLEAGTLVGGYTQCKVFISIERTKNGMIFRFKFGFVSIC